MLAVLLLLTQHFLRDRIPAFSMREVLLEGLLQPYATPTSAPSAAASAISLPNLNLPWVSSMLSFAIPAMALTSASFAIIAAVYAVVGLPPGRPEWRHFMPWVVHGREAEHLAALRLGIILILIRFCAPP